MDSRSLGFAALAVVQAFGAVPDVTQDMQMPQNANQYESGQCGNHGFYGSRAIR